MRKFKASGSKYLSQVSSINKSGAVEKHYFNHSNLSVLIQRELIEPLPACLLQSRVE